MVNLGHFYLAKFYIVQLEISTKGNCFVLLLYTLRTNGSIKNPYGFHGLSTIRNHFEFYLEPFFIGSLKNHITWF